MSDYTLGRSWGRANVQDRLWYAKDDTAKSSMLTATDVGFQMGDRVLVIATGTTYMYDGTTLVALPSGGSYVTTVDI